MAKRKESISEFEPNKILQPLDLSLEQQALLFGDLRTRLVDYVTYETRNDLTPSLKESMDLLRGVASKIIINCGFGKTLSPVEFVTYGLPNFVSKDDLEKLANEKVFGPMDEYFRRIAKFYLDQKKSEERRNLV